MLYPGTRVPGTRITGSILHVPLVIILVTPRSCAKTSNGTSTIDPGICTRTTSSTSRYIGTRLSTRVPGYPLAEGGTARVLQGLASEHGLASQGRRRPGAEPARPLVSNKTSYNTSLSRPGFVSKSFKFKLPTAFQASYTTSYCNSYNLGSVLV